MAGEPTADTNVEFHEMDAEALDLPESSSDAVLCRFGLMFLPDVDRALVQIWRLLVPGGRFVASVWGPPERYPIATVAFWTIARVLKLSPPAPGTSGIFSLADADELAGRFRAAGFADTAAARPRLSGLGVRPTRPRSPRRRRVVEKSATGSRVRPERAFSGRGAEGSGRSWTTR